MIEPQVLEEWAKYADRSNRAPEELLSKLREEALAGRYSPSTLRKRFEYILEFSKIAPAFASIILITTSVQFLSYRLDKDDLAEPGIYAVALTEGGSGSDLTRTIRTAAKKDAASSRYCIKGVKYYTSNGLYADAHLVLAVDEGTGSLELFLTRDLQRIRVEPLELEAFRGAGITRTSYECAEADKLTDGTGLREALAAINLGRLGYAGIGVGITDGALEDAIEYTSTREAFGGRLADLQGVQLMLAEIYTMLYPLKTAYRSILSTIDAGKGVDPLTAAAMKNAATTAARRAAQINLQLHGGRGLQRATRALRLFHDSQAIGIGEGAYEVLQTFIAKKLLSPGKR